MAVTAAVVATARGPGWRKSRITPAASQGTQATVAVIGNSAQEKRPPPSEKPAAASSDEARPRPVRRASSQVPSKATSSLRMSSASRWSWMGKARAAICRGERTPACGFAQGELPPSRASDQKGSRRCASACRISRSHGRSW
jgi:hypothetical protein